VVDKQRTMLSENQDKLAKLMEQMSKL